MGCFVLISTHLLYVLEGRGVLALPADVKNDSAILTFSQILKQAILRGPLHLPTCSQHMQSLPENYLLREVLPDYLL